MAMNLPARLCPRSAFGPVCGDDRVIMSSRSPTVSRGIGFVNFEWISTFYILSFVNHKRSCPFLDSRGILGDSIGSRAPLPLSVKRLGKNGRNIGLPGIGHTV